MEISNILAPCSSKGSSQNCSIGTPQELARNRVLGPTPVLWVLNLPVKILSDFSVCCTLGITGPEQAWLCRN